MPSALLGKLVSLVVSCLTRAMDVGPSDFSPPRLCVPFVPRVPELGSLELPVQSWGQTVMGAAVISVPSGAPKWWKSGHWTR